MIAELNPEIINRLKSEFKLKEHGEHLREGECPSCGKKTLWTWLEKPGMVQCNRTNNCNFQATTRELFPDLFENLNKKYPATPEKPTQTADAYLSLIRGLDPAKIKGWYEQGHYWHPQGDRGTSTVRFYLDVDKTIMWERLLDDVTITDDNGDQEVRNKNFKGQFKGLWWQPPGLVIEEKDEIYWCEGILDAIALNLNGFKAVAIMAAGTFPELSIKPWLGKGVKWVIAIDNDATGRRCLQKHARKLRELGETVAAALSSEYEDKSDWNDLHKAGKLTEKDMNQYRYLGRLELAQNHIEKALAMWKHNTKKQYFVYIFANSTYSFSIDATEFEKAKEKIMETSPETAQKNERQAFIHSSKIKEIASFRMDFLYFQQPDSGDDGQYFFRFSFSNKAPEIQLPFSGNTFGGAGDFKKAVMHKTPSALFTGTTKDLDFMYQAWMGRIPKIVKTLDYVGYDSATGAYVYLDYAVEGVQLLKLNKESFFQLKKSGIKTNVNIKQKLNTQLVAEWLPDYQCAFGMGGLVALAWWFGCLFVQQIRQQHRSYPFFAVIGEAAAGKSDMVDFLWKLLGREGESFNPNSSSLPGRTRKMAEVSNLPVVFNETDNEKITEERHGRQFCWDEQKDLFDGEFGRVTGVRSQDNSTKKPEFKAGLMIVQNIPVIASEAITSRIVHLQFDRTHHSLAGKQASERLNMLPVMDVSGFLLHCVPKAEMVLKHFNEHFKRHRKTLQANDNIKMQRIIENHAKIMALADCLPLVLPIAREQVNSIHAALIAMAEQRQEALNEEHPVVQQFWATFDYIDSKLYSQENGATIITEHVMNHSIHPDEEIAVNLESFRQRCADLKMELMDSKELRRHLPTSRKRQYVRNAPTWSRLEGRTIRCWIFKR
jgi:Toprim-like